MSLDTGITLTIVEGPADDIITRRDLKVSTAIDRHLVSEEIVVARIIGIHPLPDLLSGRRQDHREVTNIIPCMNAHIAATQGANVLLEVDRGGRPNATHVNRPSCRGLTRMIRIIGPVAGPDHPAIKELSRQSTDDIAPR